MAKAKAKAKAILTREDVHAALLHFAELAVAFEGGGIEVVDPRAPLDVPATDKAALACLKTVVSRLERHRERQQEGQRKRVAVALHDELEAVYEKLTESPDLDLDAELSAVISKQGFQPFQVDVNDLVPDKDELKGGPAVGAARNLSEFVGRAEKSFFNYRKKRSSLEVCRTAWRRWVPPRLARAYVADVMGAAIAARDAAPPPPLSDVKDMAPAFLAMLERRTETLFRDHLRAMFEMIFLGDLEEVRAGAPQMADQLAAKREEGLRLLRQHFDGDEERVQAEYRRAALEDIDRQMDGLGLQAPKAPGAPPKKRVKRPLRRRKHSRRFRI
ncbi:MAG: hypothetical protein HS104_27215 [Polyangiaceae bacterium]|nr:hypothetical protein [Polyangiaceae bacterium]MCE7890494.1 hypothetical protein [Sorangiineae bacterium PRO1]MCL4756438.1 hypothetical protein [Myxococcales bacterium]